MNNFAYISCKSAGPLQDLSFEEAAHHYSTHFDEKITGQVPLDKVRISDKMCSNSHSASMSMLTIEIRTGVHVLQHDR